MARVNIYLTFATEKRLRPYLDREFPGHRPVSMIVDKAINVFLDSQNEPEVKLACSKCGKTDGLIVHHLDKNRLNNDIDNLQYLCRRCHQKIHNH